MQYSQSRVIHITSLRFFRSSTARPVRFFFDCYLPLGGLGPRGAARPRKNRRCCLPILTGGVAGTRWAIRAERVEHPTGERRITGVGGRGTRPRAGRHAARAAATWVVESNASSQAASSRSSGPSSRSAAKSSGASATVRSSAPSAASGTRVPQQQRSGLEDS